MRPRDRREAEELLHRLQRKDFVQRSRRSSVEDEMEWSFRHVLVRDVAYSQIPRAARSDKHRLAAAWIESLGRPEDLAEMLAHHYLSALEFARVARQPTEELAERTRTALQDAGERAVALSAYGAARRFLEAASELWPLGSAERARLLFQLGQARYLGEGAGAETLQEARDALLAAGDPETAAEAETLVADLFFRQGDRDRADAHFERARSLVSVLEPSRAKTFVMTSIARSLMLSAKVQEAIPLGREALRMAELLGLPDLRAHALNVVGSARAYTGDRGGLEDLEESASIAAGANAPHEQCRALNNLQSVLAAFGELERSRSVHDEAMGVAERFGQAIWIRWLRSSDIFLSYWEDHWDQAVRLADEFLGEVEAGSPHYAAAECYPLRAEMRLASDDQAGALSDAERALVLARGAKDPQALYHALAICTHVVLGAGDPGRAATLAGEGLGAFASGVSLGQFVWALPAFAFAAWDLGLGDDLLAVLPADSPYLWVDGARAVAAGEFERAASTFARIGARPQEAQAHLRAAAAMVAKDLPGEAGTHLDAALSFYRSAGAARYIKQAEGLLAALAAG